VELEGEHPQPVPLVVGDRVPVEQEGLQLVRDVLPLVDEDRVAGQQLVSMLTLYPIRVI